MQRVGREASNISNQGVVDAANNESCGACFKEVSNPNQTLIVEETTRLWWALWLVFECHARYETTLTVTCVVRG
jgi:hypothetical protein